MKILILGAGQVGASVAATLVREDDDLRLVDIQIYLSGRVPPMPIWC